APDAPRPLSVPAEVRVARGRPPGPRGGGGAPPPRPTPAPAGARILEACGGEAASVDQLVSRTGLAPEAVTVGLRALDRQGWIEHRRGGGGAPGATPHSPLEFRSPLLGEADHGPAGALSSRVVPPRRAPDPSGPA